MVFDWFRRRLDPKQPPQPPEEAPAESRVASATDQPPPTAPARQLPRLPPHSLPPQPANSRPAPTAAIPSPWRMPPVSRLRGPGGRSGRPGLGPPGLCPTEGGAGEALSRPSQAPRSRLSQLHPQPQRPRLLPPPHQLPKHHPRRRLHHSRPRRHRHPKQRSGPPCWSRPRPAARSASGS
jgi:hypothetical protein